MSALDWLMLACGLCGAVFLAVGIRHALAGRRHRRERAKLMQLARVGRARSAGREDAMKRDSIMFVRFAFIIIVIVLASIIGTCNAWLGRRASLSDLPDYPAQPRRL
jgi:hypothetical protein